MAVLVRDSPLCTRSQGSDSIRIGRAGRQARLKEVVEIQVGDVDRVGRLALRFALLHYESTLMQIIACAAPTRSWPLHGLQPIVAKVTSNCRRTFCPT